LQPPRTSYGQSTREVGSRITNIGLSASSSRSDVGDISGNWAEYRTTTATITTAKT